MNPKIKCSQCDETFPSGKEYRPHWIEKHLKPWIKQNLLTNTHNDELWTNE